MSADPQSQEPPAPLPEVPIIPGRIIPSEPPGPPRKTSALTRGDKGWALWFFILLVLFWGAVFLGGLIPGAVGNFVMLGFLGFVMIPMGLLLGMFLITLAGPWREKRAGSAGKAFLARLALLITCGAAWILAAFFWGGPLAVGRLCGAKWGLGLDAIRRLQSSNEIAALANVRQATALEPVPSYIHSRFWGTPHVWVEPQLSGPPTVVLQWGGGFYTWGIAAGPAGEFPLPSDTYIATPWDDGVWVFVQP